MKKTTVEKVVAATNILAKVKMSKMERSEKSIILRAIFPLRSVAEDYQKFLEEAPKRLMPEGIESIEGKKEADLTPAEREMVGKFNADVNECIRAELTREVELDIELLPQDASVRLADSNPDMPLVSLVTIMDVLFQSEETLPAENRDE